MAAWKRKGGLGPFHERLVGRMVEKGYERDYAERIFKQIEGFGEYGFPESHAAGFALLVYVSCWIKRHHPDAFLAALLNSQPMGFYAPAQLVRDAREHGVEVRPVDVARERVGESVLEGLSAPVGERCAAGAPRARTASAACRDEAGAAHRRRRARSGPFASVEDLARRAALERARPAGAGRRPMRCAAWPATATRPPGRWPASTRAPTAHAARHARARGARPRWPRPREVEDMLADYRALGLTLSRHPLALLRERARRASRCSRPRCCAATRTAAWRAPAAWSRTASAPRRPRARSSSRSRTRPAPST